MNIRELGEGDALAIPNAQVEGSQGAPHGVRLLVRATERLATGDFCSTAAKDVRFSRLFQPGMFRRREPCRHGRVFPARWTQAYAHRGNRRNARGRRATGQWIWTGSACSSPGSDATDACAWLLSTSGWKARTSVQSPLYASFGFETYGIEKQAIFFDGEYFDEDLMALKLDPPSDPRTCVKSLGQAG